MRGPIYNITYEEYIYIYIYIYIERERERICRVGRAPGPDLRLRIINIILSVGFDEAPDLDLELV